MTGVWKDGLTIRRWPNEDRHRDEGRDWSEAAVEQGMSGASRSWKRQGILPQFSMGAWPC